MTKLYKNSGTKKYIKIFGCVQERTRGREDPIEKLYLKMISENI